VATASVLGGLVAGGIITATLTYLVGRFVADAPSGVLAAVTAAALLVLLAGDLHVVSFRLPQRDRLIPSQRLDMRFPYGVAVFSAELGLGWRTVVPLNAPYGLVVALVVAPSWTAGLATAVAWGIGRYVPIAWALRYEARGRRSFPLVAYQRTFSVLALVALLAWTLLGVALAGA
jgi:hypothetical protein